MLSHRMLFAAAAFVLAPACGDYGGATDMGASSTTGSFDETEVVDRAMDYMSFEKINTQPRGSQHALGDTVNVFVPSDIAADYRAIDPNADGTASFDPGAILVKEHLDAGGTATGLTIMYKAPPGLAPATNDWYWARANTDGTLAEGGQLNYCIECHSPRASTDYVFGIPADEQ